MTSSFAAGAIGGARLLIAFELSGAPLPTEHGFPVRLVVPGYYGTNSVKWLWRLRLAERRADGPFTTAFHNAGASAADRAAGAAAQRRVWAITPERIGMDRDGVVAWLAGGEGPILIETREIEIAADGELAFVSALNRMCGRQGGESREIWYGSPAQRQAGAGTLSAITRPCPSTWTEATGLRWS